MRHSCSLTPGFQSTLPRGERLACVLINTGSYIFQSTLPRGERPPAPETSSVIASFQSTLPRGERQAADSIQARKGIISIHAPTRGATKQYRAKTNVNAKFQSTLPRGERQISTYPVLWRQKFQSTLPRGERLPVQINILPALFISIHAPTRGATIARVEQ